MVGVEMFMFDLEKKEHPKSGWVLVAKWKTAVIAKQSILLYKDLTMKANTIPLRTRIVNEKGEVIG